MVHILFLPAGKETLASSRYRVYQFLRAAPDYGVTFDMLHWDVQAKQKTKLLSALRTVIAATRADVVFIQKRHDQSALWASLASRKTIFDFDDAIWLPPPLDNRNPTKVPRLMRNLNALLKRSSLIIVGNQHLATYAQQYNSRVAVIPTVIDLDQYTLRFRPRSEVVTLGWVGRASTMVYLQYLDGVLEELAQHYTGRVRLRVISDAPYVHPTLPVENVSWSLAGEVDDLRGIDIGIMPLVNTEWERGKCGFKLLQYMALGIAAVGSPVGVNCEIIDHQVNGLLADDPAAWLTALSVLIDDPDLRDRLGAEGRRTIEARYSLQAIQSQWYQLVCRATGS
jgi:glycosyltransferase involved in cell wall biosynthesis